MKTKRVIQKKVSLVTTPQVTGERVYAMQFPPFGRENTPYLHLILNSNRLRSKQPLLNSPVFPVNRQACSSSPRMRYWVWGRDSFRIVFGGDVAQGMCSPVSQTSGLVLRRNTHGRETTFSSVVQYTLTILSFTNS